MLDRTRRIRLRPRTASSIALAAALMMGAKVETWRHDTSAAFNKGKRERVVVSDAGRVRLGRELKPTAPIDAARVWDLARTDAGTVFAATGDDGKVFRREGDGAWAVAFDTEDSQALALAVLPGGTVVVGTGPGGQVVDVTDPKHPASRPDPGVKYVWDLAADQAGNLYAATGPTGQLWKRTPDGAWSLLLDSKHAHLLCAAVGPDGAIYAGSDGEGLVYRVGPDGKASVVMDAPQNEVRALLFAADGALYAGTAQDSGSGSGGGDRPRLPGASAGLAAPRAVRLARFQAPRPAAAPRAAEPPAGTAAPKPPAPGENAVYRVGPDGVPREVFRARVLVYALAWQADRLVVGTGPEGQLFEVRGPNREVAPIARLDHGQALALMADPAGDLLVGAGDPGAVLRLGSGYVAAGSLTSDVLDARLPSRFGALAWQADTPPGTRVTLQVRGGNVGEPDATWSAWSGPQGDPGSARARVPAGRFVQYRVDLATDDPRATPDVRSVTLRYQTANLPPEIAKLDVPDVSEGDGATRQAKLPLKWDASDPNGDDLSFRLHVRKDGWPGWLPVGEGPIAEKAYAWDVTALPSGTYRLRLTASDRPSNDPSEAQARERVSEPFLVDHRAPVVAIAPRGKGATVAMEDDLTRLVRAAYAVDGGEWVPAFPADGLFDTPAETLAVDLPDLPPGFHVLVVRATDAAGNTGSADAILPGP